MSYVTCVGPDTDVTDVLSNASVLYDDSLTTAITFGYDIVFAQRGALD